MSRFLTVAAFTVGLPAFMAAFMASLWGWFAFCDAVGEWLGLSQRPNGALVGMIFLIALIGGATGFAITRSRA